MRLSVRSALDLALFLEVPEALHLAVPVRDAALSAVILRDYQLEILRKTSALMRQGVRRILIQLPTGGGKTVLAGQALLCATNLGFRAHFDVHRRELIKQTSSSFLAQGLPHSFIAARRDFEPQALLHLASVQTLANRLDIVLPPDLIVVDEAHHATAATWAEPLAAYPEAFIIGLTATPERLDGRGLNEHFDAMVVGPSPAELIARGYLSPYEYFAPSIPDMTGVPTQAGDFVRSAAAAVVDRPHLVGDIVDHYLRLAPGEQGIVFAINREHSRNIAEAFKAHGVPAMHVDGAMGDKERDFFDDAFRCGDVRVGVNVGLFSEGYDVPNIGYVGMGAPTKSLVKHLQDCGRGLRMSAGKTRAVLCDHAGNAVTRQLGLPDDDREWSLEGRAKRQAAAAADAVPGVRQCKRCFRVSPSTVRSCPGCGVDFPVQERKIEIKDGQLSKLERDALRKAATRLRKKEERGKSRGELIDLAKSRGYEHPERWADHRIAARGRYA